MFTAREAYEKAQEVRNNYKRDLKELENKIEAAVFRGEPGIIVNNYLSDLVVKELYALGYKVTLNNVETIEEDFLCWDKIRPPRINRDDDPYYTIEWG